VEHAKPLPDAEQAFALLQEVRRNAEPVLRKQGWRVLSLVELCCCKDAPEHGRSLNIAGWCRPAGDGQTATRIALRLRRSKRSGHSLLGFDDLFDTMLHEMSHIIHSKHTPAFFELMDTLREEWSSLKDKGCVLDAQGFPTVGGRRAGCFSHNPDKPAQCRALALAAAERRAALGRLMGSGCARSEDSSKHEWRNLSQRARAARAAERRAADALRGLGEEELPDASADHTQHLSGLTLQTPLHSATEDNTSAHAAAHCEPSLPSAKRQRFCKCSSCFEKCQSGCLDKACKQHSIPCPPAPLPAGDKLLSSNGFHKDTGNNMPQSKDLLTAKALAVSAETYEDEEARCLQLALEASMHCNHRALRVLGRVIEVSDEE